MLKKLLIGAALLSLAGFMVSCDWLSGGILDSDPNRSTEVDVMTQFVNIQPVTYGFIEGDMGIFASMWMQQIAGVGHQYTSYEVYEVTSDLFGGFWQQVYQEGGLIDMNEIEEQAANNNLGIVAGITKLHEALMVSAAADVWGAMPYSEAVQPEEFPDPKYDTQSSIHDAMLQLIDEAIADLNAGQEFFDGSFDFAYGGDIDKWIRAAHTLKARILLNWAEVRPGNYALALQEAQQGISSTDDNWQAYHSNTVGEQNIYWQFQNQRAGYIKVAKNIVDMLKADNDPRLQFYFGLDSQGEYSGSAHGEMNEDVSWLNEDTFGDEAWDYDLVTWEENQFIIAECQYIAGNESAALATLNETLAGIETRWASYLGGASLPRYSGLTGVALLEAIMKEKYKALFLNPQIWNDWKRTGFPVLTTINNLQVPRRFLYPDDEANTNKSFPGVLGIYYRNENDPGDPAYLSYVP